MKKQILILFLYIIGYSNIQAQVGGSIYVGETLSPYFVYGGSVGYTVKDISFETELMAISFDSDAGYYGLKSGYSININTMIDIKPCIALYVRDIGNSDLTTDHINSPAEMKRFSFPTAEYLRVIYDKKFFIEIGNVSNQQMIRIGRQF